MKQDCPTYLKTIGKSKALVTTLSDTKPDDDSDDNNDEGILNAFIATVDPTDGGSEIVSDEEDLVDSKFEKLDDQDDIHTVYKKLYKVSKKHEKLYRLDTKKLSDVELDREELSTKFDETNQTIGALRFERISSAKLDEMLSLQKFAFIRTGLGYDSPSPNIASFSTTVFVSPANNVEYEKNDVKIVLASEKIDKGKSILGVPPKLDKKETKNPWTMKGNNQKSK